MGHTGPQWGLPTPPVDCGTVVRSHSLEPRAERCCAVAIHDLVTVPRQRGIPLQRWAWWRRLWVIG